MRHCMRRGRKACTRRRRRRIPRRPLVDRIDRGPKRAYELDTLLTRPPCARPGQVIEPLRVRLDDVVAYRPWTVGIQRSHIARSLHEANRIGAGRSRLVPVDGMHDVIARDAFQQDGPRRAEAEVARATGDLVHKARHEYLAAGREVGDASRDDHVTAEQVAVAIGNCFAGVHADADTQCAAVGRAELLVE